MTTLRDARKSGDLAAFVAKREAKASPPGDEATFNRVLTSMAGTSKSVPETSKPRRRVD